MNELKPCPFCGGKAQKRKDLIGSTKLNEYYYVRCDKCRCSSPSFQKDDFCKAVKAWNRRSNES